jgi:HAD superfamily hydrolase (TIGR01484 family)
MKYKALILDLDGTTVANVVTAMPSLKVIQAIAKAKDILHVCLATGRPLYKAINIINHLQLSGPCVTGGGTQIYDPVRQKIIQEYVLNRKIIPLVNDVAKKFNLEIGIFNGEVDLPLNKLTATTKVLGIYLPIIHPTLIDEVQNLILSIPNISTHKMPSWEKGYMCLDVTNVLATKLNGIKKIMNILNIKKSEIIGVGDSYNDFPLLMASGLKIAMGNAIPELKDIADYIAPTIDEDGVATIIEKFIFNS